MNKELFNDIKEGIREMIEIEAGRAKPAEVIHLPSKPKAIRKMLNLTQVEFAEFVGVNEHTLKNWEQGKRSIPKTAQTLFKVVAYRPDIILEMRELEQKKPSRKRTIARERKQTRRKEIVK